MLYQSDADRITRLLMENHLVMIHEETGYPIIVRESAGALSYEAVPPEDFAVQLMESEEGSRIALDALRKQGIEVTLLNPNPFFKDRILCNMRETMPKTYSKYMREVMANGKKEDSNNGTTFTNVRNR